MRVRALVLTGAAAAVLLSLAACAAPAPVATAPPGAVVVTADHDVFTTPSVSAPAGSAFTLFFENKETSQHNVRIWDAADTSIATTEVFGGPGARTLDVPALAAGTYRLTCDVHPAMTATLTAE